MGLYAYVAYALVQFAYPIECMPLPPPETQLAVQRLGWDATTHLRR